MNLKKYFYPLLIISIVFTAGFLTTSPDPKKTAQHLIELKEGLSDYSNVINRSGKKIPSMISSRKGAPFSKKPVQDERIDIHPGNSVKSREIRDQQIFPVQGSYKWHTFYGSINYDNGSSIAVYANSGVYLAGTSESSWDGPDGQEPLHGHSGYNDLAILKLDLDGNYQWHTFYGSPSEDYSNALVIAGDTGVYITGYSNGSWNGPSNQTPLHAYIGQEDIFILKLDLSGAYLWHTFYGSASMDFSMGITVDGSGNVFISGSSTNSWNGPLGQPPLHNFSGENFNDFVLLRLDASGAYQWHTFYGSTNDDEGYAIRIDESGYLYFAGNSVSSWTGPAGQPPLNPHSGGDYTDITIIKLDSSGTYLWHTFYGSPYLDFSYSLAFNAAGGVYVASTSEGPWDGPLGQEPLHPHSGSWDLAVLKLNPAGEYQWHTFYGSSGWDDGYGIVVDGSNGVYIVGDSENTWNGPESQPPLNAHSGAADISLVKLDLSGAYDWHTFYGSAGGDYGMALALSSDKNIYITGGSDEVWYGPAGQQPLNMFGGMTDIVAVKVNTLTYQYFLPLAIR